MDEVQKDDTGNYTIHFPIDPQMSFASCALLATVGYAGLTSPTTIAAWAARSYVAQVATYDLATS